MDGIREFLESSTIHGLTYISTSKRVLIKCLWIVIVITGFVVAGHLIFDSFLDWEESPVGTSEETLSISEVTFPKVTVCPPKGSHTALNLDLQRYENDTLSFNETLREEMKTLAEKLVEERESWEIMVDNKEFLETQKFRNWYEGISTVAFHYTSINVAETLYQIMASMINNFNNPEYTYVESYKMFTYASSGSFQTPWFGKSYDEDTFIRSVDYRYRINIPENLEKGSMLVINMVADTKEIEGGREEIALKPRGEKGETFEHTGNITIERKYLVSDLKPIIKSTFSNTNAVFSNPLYTQAL